MYNQTYGVWTILEYNNTIHCFKAKTKDAQICNGTQNLLSVSYYLGHFLVHAKFHILRITSWGGKVKISTQKDRESKAVNSV